MPENNLDPEQVRMFNESLYEVQRSLSMMGASITGVRTNYNTHTSAVKADTDSQRAHTKSLADAYREQERWNNVASNTVRSIEAFASAALSAGTNITKFDGAVGMVGSTITDLAKSLGGKTGLILGLFTEAITAQQKRVMEYGQSLLDAKDELASFGAVGKLTSEQIFEFGKDAGYTSMNMKGYAKAVKSLGVDIIGLSASVNGGVAEFAKLTEMTDEQRLNYQAMGMSIGEVTQSNADFIKLQMMSGRVITEQMKRDGSLKKSMDEYLVTINELTSVTGLQRDQAKSLMEQATSQWQFQLKMIELGEKRLKIEERLKDSSLGSAERKELENQRDALKRREDQSVLAVTEARKWGPEQGAVAAKGIATEGVSLDTQMSLMIPSLNNVIQKTIEGTYTGGDMARAISQGIRDNIPTYGGTFGLVANQDLTNRTLGINSESLAEFTRRQGLPDYGQGVRKEVRQDVTGAVAGTTPNRTGDPEEKLRLAGIELSLAAQRLSDMASAFEFKYVDKLIAEMKRQYEFLAAINKYLPAIALSLGVLATLALGAGAVKGSKALVTGAKALGGALGFGKAAKAAIPVAEKVAEGAAKAALPVATKVAEGGAAAVKPGFLMTAEEKIAERAARQAADAAKLAGAESTTLGKMAGPMGKVSKVAGKLAVPLAVAGGVYQAATGYNEAADEERAGKITHAEGNVKKGGAIGEGVGTAGGGWAGASMGAAIGTAIVPGIGTAIGGLLGGLIGAYGGGKLGKEVGKVGGDLLTDKDKESDKDVNMKLTGSFVEMTKVTLAFTKALKEASDALGGMSTGGGGGTGGTAGGGGGGRGGGDATGSTSSNGQKGMEKAMAAGYTKEQAAGLVGNLQQESGMNPTARNQLEGAQGIAQWRGERLEAFKKKYGKEVMYATLDEQMDFVLHELETTEKKAGNLLKNAKTAAEAAAIVDKFYERSAGTELAKRIANANAIAGKQAIDAANAAATKPPVAAAGTKPEETKPPVATAVPAKEEPIITITPTAEFKETSAANTPGKSTVAKTKKKAVAPEHLSGDKGGSAGINLAVPGASSEGIAGEAEAKPAKTGFADKVKSILSMIDLSPKEKGTSKYPIKHTVPKSGDGPSRDFYGAEAIAARAAAKKERESNEAAASVAEDNRKKEVQAEENRKFAEQRAAIKVAIAEGNGNKGPAKTPADIDPKTLLPRTQKLAKGGIVSNSSAGSMVTLGDGPAGHKEAAIPLDPSSIVHKLIQPGSAETLNKASDTMPIPAPVASPMSDMSSGLTVEMVEMLSQKLDTMIDKLSSGNDTQDKILMYSRA